MGGLSSLAAVTCTAAFVFGMLLALPGAVKLKLAERLGLGEGRVGGLLAALNLALMPMMLLSGLLIDALGVRLVLIAGSLLAAVAVFSLALRRNYLAALACVLVLGAGSACLSAASVVLMPLAFGLEGHLAASLNLGYVFVALGALMTPTLTDLLLRTLDFRKAVGVLALFCLVPAATALLPIGGGAAPPQAGELIDVLGNFQVLLAGIAFLFYAPLEFAVSTWGSTYLTADQGYEESRAAWVMSFFWLAFLVGRLLATLLFHSLRVDTTAAAWVIFLLAIASAAMMGNLAGAGKPRSAAWGIVLLGLALGPIFPTLVAYALHAAPNGAHGTAYGAVFAIGSAGSALLAPLLGLLMRGKSVMRALRLLAPVALLLVVVALALLGVG
ncbi:MAG TPA: MFS transporter [Gemmataceae bacterium]|nr:MFS transporter [Gemmataceae bacterium]